MGLEPSVEVGGDAYIALIWDCETLDEIDVLHEAVPLRTPTAVLRGTAFTKAGLPAEALAKAGGGHPQPDLFRPTIRVPLRATQLVAGARFGHDLTPR